MAARKMYEVRAKKTKEAPINEIKVIACSTIAAARKVANEYAKKDEYKQVWIIEYIANTHGVFTLSDHVPFVVKNDFK